MAARRLRGVVETLELELRHLLADEALDVANLASLLGRGEREGIADRRGAAGAADAVDVILGIRGNVVVDDVRHAGDVDAAGGDVRGDHHLVLAGLEAFECLDALRLRAVGVQDGDGMIRGLELAGDLVGAVLGAGENEAAVKIGLLEQCDQQVELEAGRHR